MEPTKEHIVEGSMYFDYSNQKCFIFLDGKWVSYQDVKDQYATAKTLIGAAGKMKLITFAMFVITILLAIILYSQM